MRVETVDRNATAASKYGMRQKKSSSKKPAASAAGKAVLKARATRTAKKAASKPARVRAAAKTAKAAIAKKTAVAAKSSAPVKAARKPARPSIKRANPEAPPPAPKKLKQAAQRGRPIRQAKFSVGQVVRHRIYPFRGVVFDIDPVFANTEEWLAAIPPDVRPRRNQPFYHLLAESDETEYIAYVSEQNLLPDETGQPLRHPQISEYFIENDDGTLRAVFLQAH